MTRTFSWHEWRSYPRHRCAALCTWLLQHRMHIRSIHLGGQALELADLGSFVRSLSNLHTVCVAGMGEADATVVTRALQQSQAPITAFSFSGCCLPSWLPPRAQTLVLEVEQLGRVDFGLLLHMAELQLPHLRSLQCVLTGKDVYLGLDLDTGQEACAACAATLLLELVMEHRPPALQELCISQELNPWDWWAVSMDADKHDETEYLSQLHDHASRSVHALQPAVLPLLTQVRFSTSLPREVVDLSDSSSSSDDGSSDAPNKQECLCVSSSFLQPDGTDRLIASKRHIYVTRVADVHQSPF